MRLNRNRQVRCMTDAKIEEYCRWLRQTEKSAATVQGYFHYLKLFQEYLGGSAVCKELVLGWKQQLRRQMEPVTVNVALAAWNGFCRHMGWNDCTSRFLKTKRLVFCPEGRELTKEEYCRMVAEAQKRGNERLALAVQAICATGIRISELKFITVEAVKAHKAEVECKGRARTVFLVDSLCRKLADYAKRKGIGSGSIFITRSGRPVDRSNLWREMKKLGEEAGVEKQKVFPHNLRHLFARTYYSIQKDLSRLADILGHSNVNTTRIYTMESGRCHMRQLESLDLVPEDYNRISLLL